MPNLSLQNHPQAHLSTCWNYACNTETCDVQSNVDLLGLDPHHLPSWLCDCIPSCWKAYTLMQWICACLQVQLTWIENIKWCVQFTSANCCSWSILLLNNNVSDRALYDLIAMSVSVWRWSCCVCFPKTICLASSSSTTNSAQQLRKKDMLIIQI